MKIFCNFSTVKTLKFCFCVWMQQKWPETCIQTSPATCNANKPIETFYGKLIYLAFRQFTNLNFEILTLMTSFVVQGYI